MKILITGARGFIGRNLVAELKNRGITELLEYDLATEQGLLAEYCQQAEFVFHLAGVNRPETEAQYLEGNLGFTSHLLNTLKENRNTCPVMFSSSSQASLDNPYGKSKKAGEDLLREYGRETGAIIYIYRFPNVFGKWCRPNYNSVVATFCHNIARGLPITVNSPDVVLNLVYIDDVVNELIAVMAGEGNRDGSFYAVPISYTKTLGSIADLIYSFREGRDKTIPDMSDGFTKKLYSTYMSYLPGDEFSYPLKMNEDSRGSFTEVFRTVDRGQISVNVSRPGITKGMHWHHTKCEKFLVISGTGIIRFRKIDEKPVFEYHVNGERLEVVDIPPGYTHSIENVGRTDLVTIMWANEVYDPSKPDTYFLEV